MFRQADGADRDLFRLGYRGLRHLPRSKRLGLLHQVVGNDFARQIALLEQPHPIRERFARGIDQAEQRLGRGALFLQPEVHHLLDFPGHLAQIHQADHAPAALQGMEAAPDFGQRLDFAGLRAAKHGLGIDVLQHLDRFLEEHAEQFLIDAAAYRGGGGRGRYWLHRGGASGAIEFDRDVRLGRLRNGHGTPQRRAIELEGGVRRGRSGRALFEAGEKQLDRVVRRFAAAQARIEKEPQAGEPFGDPVHVFGRRRVPRQGALRDHAFADRQRLGRALEAEHDQRAVDLVQVGLQRAERVARGGIARERVEHLLDMLQVGDDLLRDLRAQLQRADLLHQVGAQSRRRRARRTALG